MLFSWLYRAMCGYSDDDRYFRPNTCVISRSAQPTSQHPIRRGGSWKGQRAPSTSAATIGIQASGQRGPQGVRCELPQCVRTEPFFWGSFRTHWGILQPHPQALYLDYTGSFADLESRPQPSRPRPRTWPSRPRPRTWPPRPRPRTMSRPMSIWFAVHSKLQNTDVYCRARFSKLVMKLTVSFSQRTLKYFRVQWTFK